jgi:hypothetical protein
MIANFVSGRGLKRCGELIVSYQGTASAVPGEKDSYQGTASAVP